MATTAPLQQHSLFHALMMLQLKLLEKISPMCLWLNCKFVYVESYSYIDSNGQLTLGRTLMVWFMHAWHES